MKTFSKLTFRSITHSFSRFWAIFAIVALGAGFFTGLRSTGQDMRVTTDQYYDDSNMMDVRIVSTLGLTDDDVAAVSGISGVQAVAPAHYADVISKISGMEKVFRVHSIPAGGPKDGDINRPALVSGRWPQSADECVVGARRTDQSLVKIGDTIDVSTQDGSQSDQLKYKSYKIVGVVNSAYYICFNLGTTEIGNGELNYFMYIPDSGFHQSVYTEIFATVKGAAAENTFSNGYDKTVGPVISALKARAKDREQARYDQVYGDAKKELDKGKAEYATNRDKADKALADKAKKLTDGEKAIAQNEKKLADAQKQLTAGQAALTKGEAELAANRKKAEDGLVQWSAAKQRLDDSLRQWEQGSAAFAEQKAKTEAQLAQAQQLIGTGYPGAPATQAEFEQMQAAARQQLAAAQAKLDASKKQLDAGTAQLSAQKRQLDNAQAQLAAGEQTLAASRKTLRDSQTKLTAGQKALAQAKTDLAAGKKEYEANKLKTDKALADAAKKLSDGEDALKKLEKPEWYVLGRDKNVGYVSFQSDTNRMDSLSTVFPLIFFLVAALVALTSMTRMVEEERIQVGTYKALGYSNGKIASKYLIYAGLASVLGSVAGILVGGQILPRVVWSAYGILYNAPSILIPPNIGISVAAVLVSVFCTMSATYAACRASLAESPANLMLPRAPKAGKRILLERVGPVWRRMSFIWKVTARNLFRYKKRLLMTVVGIAGCTGLLLTGYGVRDAVEEIVTTQFNQVYAYNAFVGLKGGAVKPGLEAMLNDKTKFTAWTLDSSKTTDVSANGKTMSASLFVPKNPEAIKAFIHLNDRVSRAEVPFGENSVVVTEKLSKQLRVGTGDRITVKNSAGREVSFRVTGVTENYVYHYVYISPSLYRSVMGEAPDYNEVLAMTPVTDDAARKTLSQEMMEQEGVGTFTYTKDITGKYDDMIRSMNLIVLVLIISAGMLAFIVLYNLTNINVTERQRELATIKVLGFYDKEVSAYIFRETALLTVIGCVLGLGLGILLNQFVVETAEVDMIMFGRVIKPLSYVWSAAFTLLFGLIVNLVMYRKLKRIDMVESLKSVD